MKMKYGLTETKLYHVHRIFKNGVGAGGGSSEPPPPQRPIDPPLFMKGDERDGLSSK